MAPQSFTAIKKQNRLEGLLTPWSLKILTSKKPQNSFQAKHFNCHKYFQPQPSLVHVHIILIDKQIPGPKTERAQLVRYRYALYGTGTPPPKERPVSSMTQIHVHFMKTDNLFIWQVKDGCFRPTQLFQVHFWKVTLSLLTKYSLNSILNCIMEVRYLTGLSLCLFYATRSCRRQCHNQFHLI